MKEISSHGSNDLDGYLRRFIQLHAAEDIGFRSCFVPAQWARRKVLTNSSNIEQNIAKCGQGTGNMSKSLSPINGFNLSANITSNLYKLKDWIILLLKRLIPPSTSRIVYAKKLYFVYTYTQILHFTYEYLWRHFRI